MVRMLSPNGHNACRKYTQIHNESKYAQSYEHHSSGHVLSPPKCTFTKGRLAATARRVVEQAHRSLRS